MTSFSMSSDSVSPATQIKAKVSVDRNSRLNNTKVGSEYSVVIPDIPRHGIPLSTVSRSGGRMPGNVGDNNEGRHLGTGAITQPPVPSLASNTTSPQQPLIQQPLMQQPLMQQPLMQQPLMQQPLIQQPLIQQPSPYATPTFSHSIQPPLVRASLPGVQALNHPYQPANASHSAYPTYPQTVHIPVQPISVQQQTVQQPMFVNHPEQQVRYVPMMQNTAAPQFTPSYRPVPFQAEPAPTNMYPSLPSQAPRYSDYPSTSDSRMSVEAGPPGYKTLQSPRNSIPEDQLAENGIMRDDRLRQQGFSTTGVYQDTSQNKGHHSQISYTTDNVSSIMIG